MAVSLGEAEPGQPAVRRPVWFPAGIFVQGPLSPDAAAIMAGLVVLAMGKQSPVAAVAAE